MTLSATVVAQDEAERIGACIESVRGFCDEVLVVDGGSRDDTCEVAARLGARVVPRLFDDFARQHEFARTEARGEWILSVDADERASPELAAAAGPAQIDGPIDVLRLEAGVRNGKPRRFGGDHALGPVRLLSRHDAEADNRVFSG